MYPVMGVAWFLLQHLLGTALAAPMPQYLEILSNPFTTLTMTVATPPALVVSNPYTTISIMEGVIGTVAPVTTAALSASSLDPPQVDPPSPINTLPATVASTLSAASLAAVVPGVTDPPAASGTPAPNTTSAVVAPATNVASSPVAVIPPSTNTTAIFVAPGPIAISSAVSSTAPAAILTQSASNPLNSTVILSSTGIPVVSQAVSPSNSFNSTVIFSSTGLPSASPAPIVSPPPVITAPSASNSSNPITATNIASNSVQSQFNVILNSNLAAIPTGISNQAPVPSITIPLPLISSFPAAANPTANPDGSHQVVPWTVPGTNVTIIATMATPNEAPAISATSYEYTIDSMQYYISGVLNTTGGGPLNATQDPFYWDIGYGCWVEFNSNPFLGASGQQLLTYSVIYSALQGMKDALLTNGWWYLAFIEIRVGPQGQVVGYATISPSLAPKGSMPILNIDDALQALEQPVGASSGAAPASSQGASLVLPGAPGATPDGGGAAHKRRQWRWALGV